MFSVKTSNFIEPTDPYITLRGFYGTVEGAFPVNRLHIHKHISFIEYPRNRDNQIVNQE